MSDSREIYTLSLHEQEALKHLAQTVGLSDVDPDAQAVLSVAKVRIERLTAQRDAIRRATKDFATDYREFLQRWGDDIPIEDLRRFDEQRADWGEHALELLLHLDKGLS